MKRKLLTVLLVIGCLLFVMGIVLSPAPTPTLAKSIELKVAYTISTKGFHHENIWLPFKKRVEERTDGRVKITLYPGGSLGSLREAYDIAVSGMADISWGLHSVYRGRFPLFDVVMLPLGFDTATIHNNALLELYRRFPEDVKKAHHDTKLLWLHGAAGLHILMRDNPVRSLEDIKGKRIASVGFTSKIVQAVGGAPIAMPSAEFYMGLEKGVIDGVVYGLPGAKGRRINEVVKYATDLGWGEPSFFVVMNLDKWNSLPPDIQKIIVDDSMKEWVQYGAKLDKFLAELKAKWKQEGIEWYDLSPEEKVRWEKRYKPLIDKYVSDMEAKGLPGKEWLDVVLEVVKKGK